MLCGTYRGRTASTINMYNSFKNLLVLSQFFKTRWMMLSTSTRIYFMLWRSLWHACIQAKHSRNFWPRSRPSWVFPLFLHMTVIINQCVNYQIVCFNLGGYTNLDHWVAKLDKHINSILLQCLGHIKLRCSEFGCVNDGDTWWGVPIRDTFSKQRGDKWAKEKVRFGIVLCDSWILIWCSLQVIVLGKEDDAEAHCPWDLYTKPSHIPWSYQYSTHTWHRYINYIICWVRCHSYPPPGSVLLIKSHYTYFGGWTGTVCWPQWIQSSHLEIGPQMQGSTGVETSYTSPVCMIYVSSLSSTKIFSVTHFPYNTLEQPFSLTLWPKSTSPWPHQHKTWGSGPLLCMAEYSSCRKAGFSISIYYILTLSFITKCGKYNNIDWHTFLSNIIHVWMRYNYL